MNKQGQLNLQDILNQVRRAGSSVGQMASTAGGDIKRWYMALDPDTKAAIMRGLAGAAIGGTAAGGAALMSPSRREAGGSVLGPALMGALLGGGAGAAVPPAWNYMANKIRPTSERKTVGDLLDSETISPIKAKIRTLQLPELPLFAKQNSANDMEKLAGLGAVLKALGRGGARFAKGGYRVAKSPLGLLTGGVIGGQQVHKNWEPIKERANKLLQRTRLRETPPPPPPPDTSWMGKLRSAYGNMDEGTRNALKTGLIGALAGGTLGGGMAALAPRDEDEGASGILGPALMGALLGGTAGVGIPYGLKMLSNQPQTPQEQTQAVTGAPAAIDWLGRKIIGNPVKSIAAAAAGKTLYNASPAFYRAAAKARQDVINRVANWSQAQGVHPGALRANLWGLNAMRKNLSFRPGGGKMALLMSALGLGSGYVADKLIRGEW